MFMKVVELSAGELYLLTKLVEGEQSYMKMLSKMEGITPDARTDALAYEDELAALRAKLRVQVEGHTPAAGGDITAAA